MKTIHHADANSLEAEAVRSIKWSALAEVASRSVQPATYLVLARLLSPADFGVMSTAIIAVSFCQTFWDAGLQKALVQTKENPESAADVVFWTNVVLASFIYVGLFVGAPLLSLFFSSPNSTEVVRVVGLQVLVASFASVQQALLVRNLRFKQLFRVRLASALVPGLFSIPLALAGCGVWALAGGTLAGSFVSATLLWKQSPWRPRLRFDTRIAKRLAGFGAWVVGEGLIAWFMTWGDNVIVGRFLGVQTLGVYQVGWAVVTLAFGLVLNPILPVLYSAFSKLQHDNATLAQAFCKTNRVVFAAALPMGVGFALIGPDLASTLFGGKWVGLGFVISCIGLMHGVAWLVGINPEVYRAIGRPDVNAKLMLVMMLYYLPAFVIAAPMGLDAFVIVRLGVALVSIPIHVYLCTRMLRLSPWHLWHHGRSVVLSVLVMAGAAFLLRIGLNHPVGGAPGFLAISVLTAGSVVVYLLSLYLIDRPFVLETKRFVLEAARG